MFNLNQKNPISILEGGKNQYPILPLRDVVVFPNMVVPLFVGREKSIKALEHAMSHDKDIFLAAQKDATVDNPTEKDIYFFGTLGSVLQLLRLPDGTVKALIEGKQRAKAGTITENQDFYLVEVEKVSDAYEITPRTTALIRTVNESFEEYSKLNKKIGKELVSTLAAIENPSRLADTIAAHLAIKVSHKQELLECIDVDL